MTALIGIEGSTGMTGPVGTDGSGVTALTGTGVAGYRFRGRTRKGAAPPTDAAPGPIALDGQPDVGIRAAHTDRTLVNSRRPSIDSSRP